jgi:periplasmic divalent cation tolerance protein
MPLPKIITCYTTISDKDGSSRLIEQLLKSKLIACGVSWPANSQYNWKEGAVSADEHIVFMKSSLQLKERLVSRIQDFHPYDVPCILIREVECNLSYYEWVNEQTI